MNALQICSARALAAGLLAAATMLAAPVAGAAANKNNALYKCVDGAGVTSIQSYPCPAGSTQAWRRDAPSEPAMTPEQAAQADAKRIRDQQTVRELSAIVDKKLQVASGAAPAPTPEPAPVLAEVDPQAAREAASVDACQGAQAFAASVREKSWLGLSEEQVRRVYGWVAEQCKLPTPAN
jgi:hypothetical protein